MNDRKLEIVLGAKDLTDKAFDKLTGRLKALEKQVFSVQGAMGLLAGAAGLGYVIQRNLEAADAIAKTADKIGLSTDALQEYRHAAQLSGASTETLDMAMQRFTRRVAEAAQGKGALRETLEQYNIAVRDAAGNTRDTEEVLADLADVIEGTESKSERLRIAFKAFDSEGARLVNMLRGGSEGLEQMRQEARDLGLVLEEELLRESERANDAIARVSGTLRTNFQRVVIATAPVIADIGEKMAEWVKQNNDLIQQRVEDTLEAIGETVEGVVSTYNKLPDEVVGAAGTGIIGRMLFGSWKAGFALAVLRETNELMKEFDADVGSMLKKFETLNRSIQNLWEAARGKRDWRTGEELNEEGGRVYRFPMPDYPSEPSSKPSPRPSPGGVGGGGGIVGSRSVPDWLKDVDRLAKEAQASLADMQEPYNAWEEMNRQLSDTEEILARMREPLVRAREEALALYTGFRTDEIKSELDAWNAEHDEAWRRTEGIAEESSSFLVTLSQRTADAMEDNFSDFFFNAMTGKFKDLGDLGEGILESLARATSDYLGQLWKELLFGEEGGSFGGWLGKAFGWLAGLGGTESARGNVFEAGRVKAYRKGGIIPGLTVAAMANGGIAIMGEDGEEAILPLERTSSGDLGVKATGGGASGPLMVNLTIQAVDASSFADLARRNPAAITAPLLDALRGGDRAVLETFRRSMR